MDQTLTLGWTRAEAVSRRSAYRRILGVNLVLHVVIALTMICVPSTLAEIVGMAAPQPTGWLRALGGMLLLATILYVPGYLDPVRVRSPNVIGIAGRFAMALLYLLLGGGFLWFALFDAVFAVLLTLAYLRLIRAEVMSRP